MTRLLVLASSSQTRIDMLRRAGVGIEPVSPRVDEDALREALLAEGATPRDMADALAEAKARKVASRRLEDFVLGADQIAECGGEVLTKPETPGDAEATLKRLSGQIHKLHSAAVIYHEGAPVWRHVETVCLQARPLSEAFVSAYVARNWETIRTSVGAYRLEEEGARLFSRVDGDYFTVLGLPLLPVLGYLAQRGIIDL